MHSSQTQRHAHAHTHTRAKAGLFPVTFVEFFAEFRKGLKSPSFSLIYHIRFLGTSKMTEELKSMALGINSRAYLLHDSSYVEQTKT